MFVPRWHDCGTEYNYTDFTSVHITAAFSKEVGNIVSMKKE
jgi:hypothetical protein